MVCAEKIHLRRVGWGLMLATLLVLCTASAGLRAADETTAYPTDPDALAALVKQKYAAGDYNEAFKVYRILSDADQAKAELVAHEEIQYLWEKAVDYYTDNKPDQNQQAMLALWALRPNPGEIEALVNEAGESVLVGMLGNSQTRTVQLQAMLDVLRSVRSKVLGKNSEVMKKLVTRLMDPNLPINEQSDIYREIEIIGPYIIPDLAGYFNNRDETIRAKAVNGCVLIGPRAVLPVIKLLDSKDDDVKINAISVLMQIHPKDIRSVPALKRVLEDKAVTPNVRQQAGIALTILTSVPTENLRTADQYFYEEATRYFLRDAGVGDEAVRSQGLVWHLTPDGKLTYTEEPAYVWNDVMAEESALEGFALVSKDHPERAAKFPPLLACVYAGCYQDTLRMQDIVALEPDSRPLTDVERAEIISRSERYRFYLELIREIGAKYVYRGLSLSLNDKRPEVSVMLADMLAELDPHGNYLPAFTRKETSVDGDKTTNTFYVKFADTINSDGARWMKYYQETYSTKTGELVGEPSGLYIDQRNEMEKAMTDISKAPKTNQQSAPSGMEKVVTLDTDTTRPPDVLTAGANQGSVRRQPWSPTKAEGFALIEALNSEDQRIRFASAITLAKQNRYPEDFQGSDKVVSILSQAITIGGAPQILLVIEDVGKRNRIRSALEKLGFSVSESDNGRDAFDQAMGYPPKAGIIIDANLTANYTTKKLWDQLDNNLRTRYIPKALLVEPGTIPSYEALYGSRDTTIYIETKFDDFGAMQGTVKEATAKKIVSMEGGFDTKIGLAGKTLLFTTGPARGLLLEITGNEADTLFLKDPGIAAGKLPQAGDRFTIGGGMLSALRDPVEKLISNAEKPAVQANYTRSMAISAAQALAQIDPRYTNLKWQDAQMPIVQVLSTPASDELRLPCIEAARNLRVHDAAQALYNLCDPSQQSPMIVGAALDALRVVNPNLHQKAKALMMDADPYVQKHAAELGGASDGRTDHFDDLFDTLSTLRVDKKDLEN